MDHYAKKQTDISFASFGLAIKMAVVFATNNYVDCAGDSISLEISYCFF